MREDILIWIIIGSCALVAGRRFYRQWRRAVDPRANISCDCGCSGCSTSGCKEHR